MTPKQKKRQKRILDDLTYLIKTEKAKWGGGNKDLIEQFETKKEKVENWIPKIKEGLDRKKSDVNTLIAKKDKLEAEIQAAQLDEEELQRLKNSVIEATNDLNHASDELFRSLQNPLAINNQVRLGLKQFNDTLGKLKLPGDATQSFFTELCDSPECVCGTKMDEKMISHINKNSQAYFNDDWQGSLNKVKRDIINYEELVVENPTQDYLSNYENDMVHNLCING